MKNSKKFFSVCILGISLVVGCSKPNAPTNSNFKVAIDKYVEQHKLDDPFQISQSIPSVVQYDLGKNSPVNIDASLFSFLKKKGLLIKDRVDYNNVSTTQTEQNTNYSQDESTYQKKLEKYNKALAEWKIKHESWKHKVKKIKHNYNLAVKKYTDKVITPAAQWCASKNGVLWGNDPIYCKIVQQGFTAVKSTMATWQKQNMLSFLKGSAPPRDPVFPAEPVKPQPPSKPSKNLQVTNTKKVPTYIWYKISQSNPMLSCSPGNLFYAGSCSVSVGSYVFDKVLDSTAPATNANGMIVSYVTAQFHPVMRIGTSGPIKNIKFAIVQETNGWRVLETE